MDHQNQAQASQLILHEPELAHFLRPHHLNATSRLSQIPWQRVLSGYEIECSRFLDGKDHLALSCFRSDAARMPWGSYHLKIPAYLQ